MDYKKLFKSPETRNKILKVLRFIPDKTMIKMQYYIKFGRILNLKNPRRFTEKLQWYKLYYRNSLMKTCVDKADVRDYVRLCGLEEILIPLIGVYNNPNEIDFNNLPKECVIKDTLGGGGNAVILCSDSKVVDWGNEKKKMEGWVNSDTSYKQGGREWPYGEKKHRIIIEEMLPSKEVGGLIDYKFFCFNGAPKILYIIADRKVGEKAALAIYTADFEKIAVRRCDEEFLERDIPKPWHYEQMLEVAKKLSKPFPEVRVDLYYVDEKIYFGEMTFFDGSGYMSFEPDEFDYTMGDLFKLPKELI